MSEKSSPEPIFGKGCIFSIAFLIVSLLISFCVIFASVRLGAIQFTRILGANSAQRLSVSPSIAPFAVDIIDL